jgi:NAD(P)-dependent dehydrogenase (short-subunit alcohol dehydrogenase family)
VQGLFDNISNQFGQLDFAFNNAGVVESGGIEELSETAWDRVVDINLKGVWFCMRQEARMMRAQGSGAIVNNASVAGIVGIAGAAAYCASKHAVVGLTKAGALELAAVGVRVNAVCPGFIETPLTQPILQDTASRAQIAALQPIGRHGSAAEVANAVMWLCSEESGFVTGHPLVVDGGYVTG